jgi:hypothetical protein
MTTGGDRGTRDDLEAALTDIRNVTRDGSPALLPGGVECLKSVAAHAEGHGQSRFGRYSREIERGVYFAASRISRTRPSTPGRAPRCSSG